MPMRRSRVESESFTRVARDLDGAGVVLLLVDAGPGVEVGGGESELPMLPPENFPFPFV